MKAMLNSLGGLVIKGSSMLITLLLVPLTLDYLDKETFGVWVTISSVFTLLAFFDVGLGNGLRNRLSEALSNHDFVAARSYITTAYLLFGTLQFGIICIFYILNKFIPWQLILNTTLDLIYLQRLSFILMAGISIKLVFDLLTFVLYAHQEAAKAGLLLFLTNIITLIGVYIITHFSRGNLLYLGIITVFAPIFVLLIASVIYYGKTFSILRPNLKYYDRKYINNLMSIGYKFFFIQLAVIVVFYTDNLIITQLFGPSQVTTYNISFRYFNIINTIFAILIAPFWSAFTEANIKREFEWMRRSYDRLWWLWFCTIILVVFWVFAAPFAYKIWLGGRIENSYLLNICMGTSVIIGCFNNVTVVVTNGLGKIKLQLILSFFAALINIPLSILLGKYAGLGSAGVILATSISLFSGSIFSMVQARRLINQTAVGIWNQ